MAERKPLPRLSRLQRRVVLQVADFYGYTEEDLRGDGRTKSLARARMMAYQMLREQGCSTREIGRALHRDPSTVSYGIKALRRVCREEPWAHEELRNLRHYLFQVVPRVGMSPCEQPGVRWCA